MLALHQLRDAPWSVAFRYAWATLLACVFLRMVLPAAWVHTLHPLLKVAPLFPFVAKDLSHLPDALARTRAAASSAGCCAVRSRPCRRARLSAISSAAATAPWSP